MAFNFNLYIFAWHPVPIRPSLCKRVANHGVRNMCTCGESYFLSRELWPSERRKITTFFCFILEFLGLWGQIILMKAIKIKFTQLQTVLLNLPQNNLYLFLMLMTLLLC